MTEAPLGVADWLASIKPGVSDEWRKAFAQAKVTNVEQLKEQVEGFSSKSVLARDLKDNATLNISVDAPCSSSFSLSPLLAPPPLPSPPKMPAIAERMAASPAISAVEHASRYVAAAQSYVSTRQPWIHSTPRLSSATARRTVASQ